jgi:hypothetical protein
MSAKRLVTRCGRRGIQTALQRVFFGRAVQRRTAAARLALIGGDGIDLLAPKKQFASSISTLVARRLDVDTIERA